MGEKRPLTSAVWSYFIRNADNTAQCTFCQSEMKCKGSSTSGLLRHVQNIHGIDIQSSTPQNVKQEAGPSHKRSHSDKSSSNKKIRNSSMDIIHDNLDTPKALSEVLARLVTLDDIPINTVMNSYYFNYFFFQNGLIMPKNENEILNHILNFNSNYQLKMTTEIQQLIDSNYKFSLSLIVMSNLKNRQFLKLTVHDNKNSNYCLGLVYFSTSWEGREIINIVKNHLKMFNISLENHIVALITNEQRIKYVFQEEDLNETVLCLNDALHEAILDVIFTDNAEDQSDSSDSETYTSSYYENKDNDSEGSCCVMKDSFRNIVTKVRTIVKLYEDPTKNLNLQNFVKREQGSELKLVLDRKTCWNSTTMMIERFLTLKECVHNSLLDINMAYLWDEIDTKELSSLLLILNSFKIAVEALNQHDTFDRTHTTIPNADVILNTLLRKLQNMDDYLAKEMYTSLTNKISNRREEQLYCLVKYLKYPDSILSRENNESGTCSKSSIIAFAEKIFNRLFMFPKSEIYFASHCDREMYAEDVKPPNMIECAVKIDLEKEFQLFEDTGKRSEHLDLLYNALLTIKPTATSSANVFSTFRSNKLKIKNKFPTQIASAFVCLKDYFQQNKIPPSFV